MRGNDGINADALCEQTLSVHGNFSVYNGSLHTPDHQYPTWGGGGGAGGGGEVGGYSRWAEILKSQKILDYTPFPSSPYPTLIWFPD